MNNVEFVQVIYSTNDLLKEFATFIFIDSLMLNYVFKKFTP